MYKFTRFIFVIISLNHRSHLRLNSFSNHQLQAGYSSAEDSNPDYDLASPRRSSYGQLQRRLSTDRSGLRSETAARNESGGGDMFEIFRTYDGEEYTVYVREDGKRFYVDFEEQVWIGVYVKYSRHCMSHDFVTCHMTLCRNGGIFLTAGMKEDHFYLLTMTRTMYV